MEDLNRYREIIRQLITEYGQYEPSVGEIETEIIFDEGNDHYELIHSGWNGPYRIHGSVLHLDIRNGKVYIQHDGTEEGIADRLVEAGIPPTQIVLAFKPPDLRPYTEFAVA